MAIELRLLSCTEIEKWLDSGDKYWNSNKIEYYGERLEEGLQRPLEMKLSNMKSDPGNDKWYSYYTIIYQNKVVGLIGPKGKKDNNNSIEVGYGIGKDYRNMGLATVALKRFVEMFFNDGINFIVAHTLKSNIASQKVLEKCSFKLVGEEGEELIWRLGKAVINNKIGE